MSSIPQKEEEFTTEWFNSNLKGFNKINSVKIGQPSTPGGMNRVFLVSLTYESVDEKLLAPISIVIKLNPAPGHYSIQMMIQGEIYKREVRFYSQFSDKLDFLPKVYYNQMDDQHNFVLIIENAKERNAKIIDQEKEFVSLDEAMLAMEAVGKFHSKYWHKATKEGFEPITKGNQDPFMKKVGLEWIPTLFSFNFHTKLSRTTENKSEDWSQYNPKNLELYIKDYKDSWDAMTDVVLKLDLDKTSRFKDSDVKKHMEKLTKLDFSKQIEEFTKKNSEEYPRTLIHGDFRSDNTGIQKDNLFVFDWQCVALSCGLVDVARFLVLCLDPEFLEKNEKDLLKKYHESLGVDVSFDEIQEMYKQSIWNEAMFSALIGKGFKTWRDDYKTEIEKVGRPFDLSFIIWERTIKALSRHYCS